MEIICPKCREKAFKKSGKIKLERVTRTGFQTFLYQAYRCMNEHLFTAQTSTSSFTNSFIEYVVYAYLRALSLNTVIQLVRAQFEKELLSKKTVLELVETVADRLPTLTDIDGLFHPRRSGYLAFDGVYFKLEGEAFVVLICFDSETFDVLGYRIAAEEDSTSYRELGLEVKKSLERTGTKIVGLYGDGEKGLLKALNEVFPEIPFQLCIVHKYLRMGQVVPFKSVNRKGVFYLRKKKILKFKRLFEEAIFAKSKERSLEKFAELKVFAKAHGIEKFHQGYRILRDNFPLTLTHYDYPHMARDNNLIECFNSIISRKLDLFKGFKKDGNIDRYLKLILLDYRFHELSESRFSYRRDQSPLQLAGVQLPEYYNFLKLLRTTLTLNFEN